MNPLLIAAGAAGFTVVALGAFGAHGLEGRLGTEAMDWWETATLYGLVHCVGALAALRSVEKTAGAALCFLIGVLLFSGSLYAMALASMTDGELPRWLGPITPLGGLFFLIGWGLIALRGLRQP